MKAQMQRILASKQAERARLAALPFVEKLAILEQLRDRTLAVESSALYQTRGVRDGRAWMVRETASPGKVGQAFLPAQEAERAQTGMSAPPLKKKTPKSVLTEAPDLA